MNFEFTYITLFGFKLFEPVTILTNSIITFFAVFAFFRTNSNKDNISKYWSMFFLCMGVSCILASITHGVHYQFGEMFLKFTWFLFNAFSLISIYYFYRAAFTYSNLNKESKTNYLNNIVLVWIGVLLLITFVLNDFLVIKIHAGIVMVYSLFVHVITYRQKQAGSGYIVAGILVSFIPIFIHSIKFSFGEWFNYKDISHVMMLTAMILFFYGVRAKVISDKELVHAN